MKKVLKYLSIFLVLLVAFLIAAPFLFKDKIIRKIKEEANTNLNAKFNFSALDVSLIRNFPNLSVQLEDLSIINLSPFEGDTLVYAKNFNLTLDIMSVIRGSEIKIKKVSVDNPVMNFLVNKLGKSNWDIAKSTGDSKASSGKSSFKASLQQYSISHGNILYSDQTMPFMLHLTGVDHTGSGDFTQDLFMLKTKSDVKIVDMSYGGIKYISSAKAEILADLDMDMKNMKFTFKENKILLNALELGVNGWVAMPDTNIDMDLKFDASKSEFKNFLSLIPALYTDNFKDLKSSGTLKLAGGIKGRYNAGSMPGFELSVNLEKGMFKYPLLPSSMQNVFMDLSIKNPDGIPDHTFINLSRLHTEMNGDNFDAKLILKTPVSDPDIDAFLKGKIDLSGINKLVPLEKGTSLSGIITSDLLAKGRLSAIQQKKYDQFNASGNFGISGMIYSSKDTRQPVNINSLQLAFSPQRFALNTCIAKIGRSDFNASGTLDNVLAYAIKNEKLQGTLNLNSATIDLNEFMGTDATPASTTDSSQMTSINVPANIDFAVTAVIGKLLYQNLTINNVKGALIIRDQTIRMKDVQMQMMDGSIALNGGYSSVNIKKPTFDFSFSAKNFDIRKTTEAFQTIGKMAPIAKHCTGKFSVEMNMNADLDQKMEPVMKSLTGAGKLNANNITVSDFPVFNKIADVMKMDSWKRFVLPSVNPSFKFVNGRVFVDPFEVNINGIKATVAGSNGFDETIDYTMATQIPRASFGGAANSVLNNLVSSANSKGANVSLSDIVPVNITIGGTVPNPKIGTDLNKAGAKAMDDLKAKAKEELDAKKAEAEARAKEEIEKAKKDVAAKLDAEKQKVASEAERIKKEAEAKAKAKSDSLKKAAEKKAADELKKFNPFKK